VAKLVSPACYGSYLGSNPDISQKYKMGDISKGVANIARQKIYINKLFHEGRNAQNPNK
jgi:hypothetical protein